MNGTNGATTERRSAGACAAAAGASSSASGRFDPALGGLGRGHGREGVGERGRKIGGILEDGGRNGGDGERQHPRAGGRSQEAGGERRLDPAFGDIGSECRHGAGERKCRQQRAGCERRNAKCRGRRSDDRGERGFDPPRHRLGCGYGREFFGNGRRKVGWVAENLGAMRGDGKRKRLDAMRGDCEVGSECRLDPARGRFGGGCGQGLGQGRGTGGGRQ